MASWNDEPSWINECHFLGPYKTLYEIQMEANQMGKLDPPWLMYGWEKIEGEWYACLTRSTERVDQEKVKPK